jgi:catalase
VSSHKGLVLAQNVAGDDSSFIGKLTKGSYDAATFVGAYAGALAQHRHWERDVSGVAF